MKKVLFATIFAMISTTVDANDVVVNKNVLEMLNANQTNYAPKFPIMPKRATKPVVKKTKATAKTVTPKVVVAKKIEQAELLKEFEEMQPVAKSVEAIAQTPKTLELMPGIKVAPIREEKPVVKTKILKPTPVVKKEVALTPVKKPEPQAIAKPITKAQKTESKPAVGHVLFESFEATLNDANKKKVDEIVATFKNPKENKISIIAYNVEDGVDAFKKKRQVLNHALDIRNYLAEKGFNNLSLRVLSVKGEPEKTNLVEISEM